MSLFRIMNIDFLKSTEHHFRKFDRVLQERVTILK